MIREEDTKLLKSGNETRRSESVTVDRIRDAAYELSDNGRCWWIERYIKNTYYKKFPKKNKLRRR